MGDLPEDDVQVNLVALQVALPCRRLLEQSFSAARCALCTHQVGIVSFGIGCGEAQSPGVYTDIRRYRRWISDTILVRPAPYLIPSRSLPLRPGPCLYTDGQLCSVCCIGH